MIFTNYIGKVNYSLTSIYFSPQRTKKKVFSFNIIKYIFLVSKVVRSKRTTILLVVVEVVGSSNM